MTGNRGCLHALLLVMVLVMPAAPAFVPGATGATQSSTEDWYQLYSRAKDDLKRQAWADAEQKLLQAKKAGPSQGPRTLVRGGLIVPFSADYYLGEAYLGQGRAKEAIAAFDAAGKQNLNTRTGEFAALGARRTTAVAHLADELIQTAQADVAKGDLGSARTKAQEARALGGNAAGVENLLAGIKAAEDRASVKTADATGGAANPPPPIKETPPPVTPPSEPTAGTTNPPATTTPDPGTAPGPKAVPADPVRPPVYSDSLAERAAMRQFFNGDYQGALDTLAQLNSPRALYYKACSRAGIVLLSGRSDPTVLPLARQEYQKATSGTANFARDEPYISPRVLQLLQRRD